MATDDWSTDSAILHTRERGVGFDSSHRNLNENFAPVTLITTTNEYGRMVPSECTHQKCPHRHVPEHLILAASCHVYFRRHPDRYSGSIFTENEGKDRKESSRHL
jgi:hypothetical protein